MTEIMIVRTHVLFTEMTVDRETARMQYPEVGQVMEEMPETCIQHSICRKQQS